MSGAEMFPMLTTCALCGRGGGEVGIEGEHGTICAACYERVRAAGNGHGTTSSAAPTFSLLGLEELLALPDLAFVIDGLVPLDGLSVIFGGPATFKSFLALDWALCVAAGVPWYGRDVRPGHVVYVAGEGRGGLKQRVVAWWEARGRPDLSRAHFLPEAVNLLDKAQVARARATLALLPERARMLVVDTMARSMVGGDENSAQDVGRFIDAVDNAAAEAKLVVHHTGKDGKDERGSSALRGAADLMVKATRDGKSPRVTFTCDKSKDLDEWAPITMQRELAGDSCVLSMVQDGDTTADLRRRVLAYVTEHGPVSQNAIEEAVTGKATAIREALKRLDRNNRIHRTGNVRDHPDELGVVRKGNGPKPRLRFDLARALASSAARSGSGRSQPSDSPKPSARRRQQTPRNVELVPIRSPNGGRRAA